MTAAVPAGDPGAHTWPCPLFYVNEDRTATCTCASTAPGIPDAPTPDPGALLDRLEEARKAATAGPWGAWNSAVVNLRTPAGDVFIECDHHADAVLIAEMHAALPDLIRLARDGLALRAEVATAWGEGHAVGWEHCQDGNYGNDYWDDDTANPYCAVVADTSGEGQ